MNCITKKFFVVGALILGHLLVPIEKADAASCLATTNYTNNGAGGWNSCETTPDALKVKFYRLALCKSKPTYDNSGDCVFLLDKSSPVETTISVGKSSNLLVGDISIPEGTYPYAMLLIDTTIEVKTTFEFAAANPQFDGQTQRGTGTKCWTNGNTITWGYSATADQPMTCGSNPNPQFSSETFKAFGEEVGSGVTNKILNFDTPTTVFDVYLLSDRVTPATVGKVGGYPVGDAVFIWGVQTFKSPPRITSKTTNVNLGFKLTNGIDLNFNGWQGVCGGSPCVEGINVTSFAFVVDTK